MALCGWKTRSVFDRYRIVNEADLADGLGKLAAVHEAPTEASGNVGLPQGRRAERSATGLAHSSKEMAPVGGR